MQDLRELKNKIETSGPAGKGIKGKDQILDSNAPMPTGDVNGEEPKQRTNLK